MTKMAACYRDYQFSISQGYIAAPNVSQQQQMPQIFKKSQEAPHQQFRQQKPSYIPLASGELAVATVTEAAASVTNLIAAAKNYINTPKNFFVPLHVDCSVEYELPKQPKPPAGQRFEPLLMIHPCYFRKMESQRRSPFINNMPNTSRNGAATIVGVTLVSQGSNIALASASNLLKKTSIRNHQHHYNTRQNLSSQYKSNNNADQQQQLHQLITKQQHKPQHSLSLMPRAQYSEGSTKFLEHHSTPIQRTSIAIVNRTNHHTLCSTREKKNQSDQQDLLVQNSSSPFNSATGQWDQLAAIKSSIAGQNPNRLSSATVTNFCETAECSIVASSTLGKRDTMISGSGGYSTNPESSSNNIAVTLQNQINKSNNRTSSGKNSKTIVTNRSRYEISTSLVDSTKLPGNSKTNSTPSLFMIDQSPIANVPSNFQAGPDTAPTTPLQNKYRIIIDCNNESINEKNILTSNQRLRHYLRSHRVHPYLTATSSHSDSTALSSEPVMAARGEFPVLPQFSAAKPIVAVSTATSFQHQMQQISCYNV